jgi:type I restriction enzyme, S subunit
MREDWIECVVEDVSDRIHYGFTATAKPEGKGTKYLRITDIQDGKVDWPNVPVCEIEDSALVKYQLFENDLVFARTGGTVGKSFLLKKDIPKRAIFASYLIRVLVNKNIHPQYIYAFFQSANYWSQIELGKTGLKTNVNAQILGKLKFPLAPLPEQRAIVGKIEALFSELDNGIANLKGAREKLDIYRQAVLKKAFEGELTKEWRAKQTDLPTAAQLLEQIKTERQRHYDQKLAEWEAAVKTWEENGKSGKKPGKLRKKIESNSLSNEDFNSMTDLPLHWVPVRLVQITKEITDGDHQAPPKADAGVPFITISNIKANKVDFAKTFFVPDEYYNSLPAYRKPTEGDVLYTVTGSFGIPVIVDYSKRFCFQRHIGLVRSFDSVTKKWLYWLLQTQLINVQAVKKATGTAQKTVGLASLRNFCIPFCSTQEQTKIVQEIESRLSVSDKLTETIDSSLQQAEALRQSILKKAFEGELLTDEELTACRAESDWEPASRLLERCRVETKSDGAKTGRKKKR